MEALMGDEKRDPVAERLAKRGTPLKKPTDDKVADKLKDRETRDTKLKRRSER